ncbi:MAG: FliM/FliN family flagellar motor switch protein [Cyanobacteria bacterium REEB65]|nr:FliM/FliN family flagellar motor switch protein [Cyanobacteria bacterium REEB65]
MEELSAGGTSTQFRALYYLGSLMAQALTEYVDEDNPSLRAAWSVAGIDNLAFSALAERFGQHAIWGVIQYTEQPGGSFLLLDEDTARVLIGSPPAKPMSDDQFALLDTILARVTDAFGQAWSDLAILEPQLGVFAEAPDVAELQEIFVGLSGTTPLACTTFRANIPGQPLGRIVLATPQPYLIPLGRSLEAAAEMTFRNGRDDAIDERLEYLADVAIPISVVLGTTQMTLLELQNLEESDVILLDQPVVGSLPLRLGGARVTCKPGTTSDGTRRAVQIMSFGGER